jgi:hypothetical protein
MSKPLFRIAAGHPIRAISDTLRIIRLFFYQYGVPFAAKVMTREVSTAPLVDQFRQRMEDKTSAEAAIRDAIPAFFLTQFQFETMELAPLPFSGEICDGLSAGIVYKCQVGRDNEMLIALVLDAGIEQHRKAHFDMLQFKISTIMDLDLEESMITKIIPILFWPGAEKQTYHPWDTIFAGGKLDPDLSGFMPNGDYIPANFVGE